MSDFAYAGVPRTLHRGWHTFQFENGGRQEHIALVERFRPGKTLADLVAWGATQKGEPPTVIVGGAASLSPGRGDQVRLDLAPGHYVVLCVLNNGTAPKLHAELGMLTEFDVE
jgi:hypothetical protein